MKARDLPYWKSGESAPDVWMAKARAILTELGGRVVAEAFAQDANGRAVYMMAWAVGGDNFRADWPVAEAEPREMAAARRQAATSLYHYVKASALAAAVLGARSAFMPFLLLPNGRTAGSVGNEELAAQLPRVTVGPAPLMLEEAR